jgi:hypothetical protein
VHSADVECITMLSTLDEKCAILMAERVLTAYLLEAN